MDGSFILGMVNWFWRAICTPRPPITARLDKSSRSASEPDEAPALLKPNGFTTADGTPFAS